MTASPDEPSGRLPTAGEIMQKMALAEGEKASGAMRGKAQAEAAEKELIDKMSKPSGVSDEEAINRVALILDRAAKSGLTEVQVYRFPNRMRTDGGRAINQQEAGWEDTLTGVPKHVRNFCSVDGLNRKRQPLMAIACVNSGSVRAPTSSIHGTKHEIELKLLIDKHTASELWRRARLLGLATGSPKAKKLRSIYLDTSERALKRAGITLRLRRDQRRWIQTVKVAGELHAGLSRAGECENLAPRGVLCLDAIPNANVRDEIIHIVNGEALLPVCETVFKRSFDRLSLEDGTHADLSIDIGEIRAGGRSASFCEVEIELIEGSPSALFDIARRLLPDGGLTFSRLSKSTRGYMLGAEGRIGPPLAPRYAEAVVLEPSEIAELAARDILRECFAQIAMNMQAVRELDDPEGPHQLRVGLRRLRSAFSVFSWALRGAEPTRLCGEAQWLGQEVGHLSDLGGTAKEIAIKGTEAGSIEPGFPALANLLEKQAATEWRRTRKLLTGARAQAFLIDLARFIETRGWLVPDELSQAARLAVPTIDAAVDALRKRWKKVCLTAGEFENLDIDQRQKLRGGAEEAALRGQVFLPIVSRKASRSVLATARTASGNR